MTLNKKGTIFELVLFKHFFSFLFLFFFSKNGMKQFNVTVGENGRMIIPSLFRKTLNLKAGDELVVKLSPDNDIVIHSPKQSLKKLQDLFKSSSESFVDELLEMRRKEEI